MVVKIERCSLGEETRVGSPHVHATAASKRATRGKPDVPVAVDPHAPASRVSVTPPDRRGASCGEGPRTARNCPEARDIKLREVNVPGDNLRKMLVDSANYLVKCRQRDANRSGRP